MRIIRPVLLCLICGFFLAAAPWTLTTADFEKRQVELLEISPEQLIVQSAGGERVAMPMERFLSLTRSAAPAAMSKPAFTLHLDGGGRLAGSPDGITGETLAWKSDAIGPVPVSVRSIVGMTRGSTSLAPITQPPAADQLRLANGDLLEGVIADISGEGVGLLVDGQLAVVPLDSVVSIRFATVGGGADATRRAFLVRLGDGSSIAGQDLKTDGQSLTFTVAGEARTVPLAAVRSIDQVNGPVAWISDLSPTRDEQTPFIGDPVPTRFNTSLDNRPLAVGEQRFGKGIAVHARSVLVFDLPEGYKAFRTQYAIDGDRPQANVTVRIKLDDRIIHEQADVVAGRLYPVVQADLAGAKRLTLEVDYGQTYDVQDRFLWVEPALLR